MDFKKTSYRRMTIFEMNFKHLYINSINCTVLYSLPNVQISHSTIPNAHLHNVKMKKFFPLF